MKTLLQVQHRLWLPRFPRLINGVKSTGEHVSFTIIGDKYGSAHYTVHGFDTRSSVPSLFYRCTNVLLHENVFTFPCTANILIFSF